MADVNPEVRLRGLILDVLDRTATLQKDMAKALGYTPKHINSVLRGRTGLTVSMAEKMLRYMGYELFMDARPLPEVDEHAGIRVDLHR